MVKRSKYKLFSYLVENHLIYYKSLNKSNRIIAFAILKYKNLNSKLLILNEFLRKRVIQYYSIQLEANNKYEKILIINFEDSKKEKIIKAFNIIQQKLIESTNYCEFLRDKRLEKHFLDIIVEDIDSYASIISEDGSFSISTKNKTIIFDLYEIKIDSIKKKNFFFSNFLSLINNLGRNGYLIFQFTLDSDEIIKFSSYFLEKLNNNIKSNNIEEIINKFFHTLLIKKRNLKMREFINCIWRLGLTDDLFSLNNYYDLFFTKNPHHLIDLSDLNGLIEENLLINQIEYIRLNKNLLYIEQNYLFILLKDLDSNYIKRIIERFYPKYVIYILIISYLGYEKLLEMTQIKFIENIKIINLEEVHKINYKAFKSMY